MENTTAVYKEFTSISGEAVSGANEAIIYFAATIGISYNF
jgi:hypothetical protein